MGRRPNYETDSDSFSSDAYRVEGCPGVACAVLGWETEPDEETEWSGYEVRTGRVVACMIGDDHRFTCDPEEITPLGEGDYCPGCGQIGCHGDLCG